MRSIIDEMVGLIGEADCKPTHTDIPGLMVIGGEVPEQQLAAIYQPMIGLLVQGRKSIWIGDQCIEMNGPSYFVIPTELPATGRVWPDSSGKRYLSVGLELNLDSITDLLGDIDRTKLEEDAEQPYSACKVSTEFLDAWLRMLRLLRTPEHIAALAPAYEREILFRVLLGPQGWRLRQLCLERGTGRGIQKALHSIRTHYASGIDIPSLAERAGMGLSTFHRQFKKMAGVSPLQFQKQLRLLEARKLIAFGGYSASSAAFTVGYESVSQFNREYSRFFGAPPAKDAARLREIAQTMPENNVATNRAM
ncbi:MAG: AraC family transcriptional regulator [Leptospiraceae bacterium]|nr:AraC family transcriptional regulator [Leptospiraceae bacterium]